MPVDVNPNKKDKVNTDINTTTEVDVGGVTDKLEIDKNGKNVVINNLLKLTEPQNLLGTKKNGKPRAVYDVAKDVVKATTNPPAKKKKKKKKHKDDVYSFLFDIKGKKKKKKKKHKKNKYSKILGF